MLRIDIFVQDLHKYVGCDLGGRKEREKEGLEGSTA